jgi:ABC-type thiamin/hydroxymethylpyrimidine transport system permease subunit
MKMETKPEQDRVASGGFIFRLGLADVLRLTMFGTIIALANDVLRMPLHLPGHTNIWWMGIMVLGVGLIPRPGAGTIMGLVSALVTALFGLGVHGLVDFFMFLIPGVLLDLLAFLFRYRLESLVIGAICGALIGLSKLLVSLGMGTLLHMSLGFLFTGLAFPMVTHLVFGAIGGLIAAVLVKRLRPRMVTWE